MYENFSKQTKNLVDREKFFENGKNEKTYPTQSTRQDIVKFSALTAFFLHKNLLKICVLVIIKKAG
jgi:hypothetical protein